MTNTPIIVAERHGAPHNPPTVRWYHTLTDANGSTNPACVASNLDVTHTPDCPPEWIDAARDARRLLCDAGDEWSVRHVVTHYRRHPASDLEPIRASVA